MDCSPPGSSAHGILQARVLEWGAIAPSTRSASFPVEVIILCPNNFSFINLLCKQQSKFSDSDIPCFTPILVIYVLQFLRTIIEKVLVVLGFSGSSDSKRSAYSAGDLGSIPGLGRCPGEKNGNPLQYSCLENPKDRGARWATVHGFEESDTTERLHLHFSLSCIGEGNGNPLQYCLENSRDRGAWWAAIYGVAQSRTRLKRLSSTHIHIHTMPVTTAITVKP